MVKNVTAILILISLLFGISAFEMNYINNKFAILKEEFEILAEKTKAEEATAEDGKAIKSYWDETKKNMHVWVPHNDLSAIDLNLNEAIGYLEEKNYASAYPKIVLLTEISERVPSSYSISVENIF